jgi:hypothetical protein
MKDIICSRYLHKEISTFGWVVLMICDIYECFSPLAGSASHVIACLVLSWWKSPTISCAVSHVCGIQRLLAHLELLGCKSIQRDSLGSGDSPFARAPSPQFTLFAKNSLALFLEWPKPSPFPTPKWALLHTIALNSLELIGHHHKIACLQKKSCTGSTCPNVLVWHEIL